MTTNKDVQQYVLLPLRGLRAQGRTASAEMRDFLIDTATQFVAAAGPRLHLASFAGAMVKPVSAPGLKLVAPEKIDFRHGSRRVRPGLLR